MHSNRTKINRTVEICMELFFRTIVISMSGWLYKWELPNSSNKFAANLKKKGSFFDLTLYRLSNPPPC